MARKKSVIGSILSATVFTAVAASVGYLTYRGLSSKSAKPGKGSVKEKQGTKRPKGSISRRKGGKVSKSRPSSSDSRKKPEPAVKWIPNLRVREQKILNAMPQGKDVSMSDIADKFKDVTVRTLRRDMESLVEKGRISKSGSTRATTYRRV